MADPLPIRSTRKNRRILLVLLSEAVNLGGYTICQAADVGAGHLYPVLERLKDAGWVKDAREQLPPGGKPTRYGPDQTAPRTFYYLTLKGRACAMKMLGLEEGEF